MKIYSIIILLGLTGIFLSSCSDEETTSAKKKQLSNLSGKWEATTVTMGGMDVTSEYSSFELTLSGSAKSDFFDYYVAGRPDPSPWPDRGTWSFGSDLKSEIMRDPGTNDALLMSYSLTDSRLVVEFTFIGLGYQARTKSAETNWVYVLERK